MALVMMNGPCGAGKSTTAERLHKCWPLSMLINIDNQRKLFQGYKEQSTEAFLLARDVSLAMARAALMAGKNVIVDKIVYEESWIEPWFQLGREVGVPTYEFILWAPKETVLKRTKARGYKPGGVLTPASAANFWDLMDEYKKHRPGAYILDSEHNTPEQRADQIKKIVG